MKLVMLNNDSRISVLGLFLIILLCMGATFSDDSAAQERGSVTGSQTQFSLIGMYASDPSVATEDTLACQAQCSLGIMDLEYYFTCQLDAGSDPTSNSSCDLDDLLASVSERLAELDQGGFTSVDADTLMQITATGGSGADGQDVSNTGNAVGEGGASGISTLFTTLNILKSNYFGDNSPVLYYFLGEQGSQPSAGGAASIVATNKPSEDNPLIIPDFTGAGLDNTQANVLMIAGGGGGGGSAASRGNSKMNGFDGGAGGYAIPEVASLDVISATGMDGAAGGSGSDEFDADLVGSGGNGDLHGKGGAGGVCYQSNYSHKNAASGHSGIGGEGGSLATSSYYADWSNTDVSPVFTLDGEAGKGANATLQGYGAIELNLASGGGGYGGGGGGGVNAGLANGYHSAGAGGGGSYAAASIVMPSYGASMSPTYKVPNDSETNDAGYRGDGKLFVMFFDQSASDQ